MNRFILISEPLMRIELMTSSLPRKCSTTELQWLNREYGLHFFCIQTTSTFAILGQFLANFNEQSGKRDSNPPPTAWKAVALPDELFPLFVGRGGFEPPKAYANRFTVCPIWPLWNLPNIFSKLSKNVSLWTDSNRRPADYKSAALAN